jgi:hypothetical protein
MIAMLKNGQGHNKEEKLSQCEEKRKTELEDLLKDFAERKKSGLAAIKERYNGLALRVKVDASAIQEELKRLRKNFSL